MPKALALSGLIVGGLIAVLFLVDMVPGLLGFGTGWGMKIAFIVCGLALCYLGWSALKDAD